MFTVESFPKRRINFIILLSHEGLFQKGLGYDWVNICSMKSETYNLNFDWIVTQLLFSISPECVGLNFKFYYASWTGKNPVLDLLTILFIRSKLHCGCSTPWRNSSIPKRWSDTPRWAFFKYLFGSLNSVLTKILILLLTLLFTHSNTVFVFFPLIFPFAYQLVYWLCCF